MEIENLKKSAYLISVKLDDSKTLLIHGYTGAMDVVSNKVADYVNSAKSISIANSSVSEMTLKSLFNRGYLTHKSKEEEIDYVQKVSNILSKRNHKCSMKSFTLVVTYDCNFRCPYCFEKDVIKKEHNAKDLVISKLLVDRFFETISLIEPNRNLCNKAISLFGGEPLLKENKEIVQYIVQKGQEAGFVFIATSNGYDLDCFEYLLGEKAIRGVQITLDGSRDVHDTRRIHSVNIRSFDKIVKNIKLALSKGVAIKVRINVDEDNVDDLQKLDTFFREEGLYDFERFSAYASYISGQMNFNPEAYIVCNTKSRTRKDFLELFNRNNWGITYEQELYGNISHAMKKRTALALSPSHCNAHFGSFIFDPFGNIYSCLEQVGKKTEIIGTYMNGLKWNQGIKEKWFERKITSLTNCYKCKYALLCGGGCYAKCLETDNQISCCDDLSLRLNSVVRKIYSTL